MSSDKRASAYEEVIRELQDEFLEMLPERVIELRSALTLFHTDPAARTTVQRLGHRLGGTAATVGFDAVGHVGRAIEHFVAERSSWSPSDLDRLSAVVALLDDWTREARRHGGSRDGATLIDPRVDALMPPGVPR